jgi:hypothetical protein
MSNQDRATARVGILQVATFVLAMGAVALSLGGIYLKSEPTAAGKPPRSQQDGEEPATIVRERVVVRDQPRDDLEAGDPGAADPPFIDDSMDMAAPPEDLQERHRESLAEREFMLEQAFETSPATGGMAGVRDRQIELALTQSFGDGGHVQGVECRATECRVAASFDNNDAARLGLRALVESIELHDMGFHVAPRDTNDWTEVAIYFHAGEAFPEETGS